MRILRQKLFFNYAQIRTLYGEGAEKMVREARNKEAARLLNLRAEARRSAKYSAEYEAASVARKAERLKNNPENFNDFDFILRNKDKNLGKKLTKELEDFDRNQERILHQAEADFKAGKITSKEADRIINPIMNKQSRNDFARELNRKYNSKALQEAGEKESEAFLKNRNFDKATYEADVRKRELRRVSDQYNNVYAEGNRVSTNRALFDKLNEANRKAGKDTAFGGNYSYNLNDLRVFNSGKVKGLRDNAFVSVDRKTGKFKIAKDELTDAAYNQQREEALKQLEQQKEIAAALEQQKKEALEQQREQRVLAKKRTEETRPERTKILEKQQKKNNVYEPPTQPQPKFVTNTDMPVKETIGSGSTVSNNPQAQTQRQKSNIGKYIGIGTGTAALGTGGYYLYQKNKKND